MFQWVKILKTILVSILFVDVISKLHCSDDDLEFAAKYYNYLLDTNQCQKNRGGDTLNGTSFKAKLNDNSLIQSFITNCFPSSSIKDVKDKLQKCKDVPISTISGKADELAGRNTGNKSQRRKQSNTAQQSFSNAQIQQLSSQITDLEQQVRAILGIQKDHSTQLKNYTSQIKDNTTKIEELKKELVALKNLINEKTKSIKTKSAATQVSSSSPQNNSQSQQNQNNTQNNDTTNDNTDDINAIVNRINELLDEIQQKESEILEQQIPKSIITFDILVGGDLTFHCTDNFGLSIGTDCMLSVCSKDKQLLSNCTVSTLQPFKLSPYINLNFKPGKNVYLALGCYLSLYNASFTSRGDNVSKYNGTIGIMGELGFNIGSLFKTNRAIILSCFCNIGIATLGQMFSGKNNSDYKYKADIKQRLYFGFKLMYSFKISQKLSCKLGAGIGVCNYKGLNNA